MPGSYRTRGKGLRVWSKGVDAKNLRHIKPRLGSCEYATKVEIEASGRDWYYPAVMPDTPHPVTNRIYIQYAIR
jgi:hypothetical protein